MKRLLPIALLLLFRLPVRADIDPGSVHRLVGAARYIAIGTVQDDSIEKEYFKGGLHWTERRKYVRLKVENYIFPVDPLLSLPQVLVLRPVLARGAFPIDMKVGQRYVVFVTRRGEIGGAGSVLEVDRHNTVRHDGFIKSLGDWPGRAPFTLDAFQRRIRYIASPDYAEELMHEAGDASVEIMRRRLAIIHLGDLKVMRSVELLRRLSKQPASADAHADLVGDALQALSRIAQSD